MADIFDLARSINLKREQASKGYSSGWEDLPLQVMEVMKTRAEQKKKDARQLELDARYDRQEQRVIASEENTRQKEHRVDMKNDSLMLTNLLNDATTKEDFDMLEPMFGTYIKEASSSPDTVLFAQDATMKMSDKRQAYDRFNSAMEWADKKQNEQYEVAGDEGETSFAYKDGLKLNVDDLTSLNGNDFNKLLEEFQSYEEAISQGAAYNFKYTKGSTSNKSLNEKLTSYKQSVDSAIKAHLSAGVITENEAVAITMGEYDKAKKEAVADFTKDIKSYEKRNDSYQRMIDGITKAAEKDATKDKADGTAYISAYINSTYTQLESDGIDSSQSPSKLIKDLNERIAQNKRTYITPLKKRRFFWTGMGKDAQYGTPDIFDNEDGESPTIPSEPPVSEEVASPVSEEVDSVGFNTGQSVKTASNINGVATDAYIEDMVKSSTGKTINQNVAERIKKKKPLRQSDSEYLIENLSPENKKLYIQYKKNLNKKKVAKEFKSNAKLKKSMKSPNDFINLLALTHIPEYRKLLNYYLKEFLNPVNYLDRATGGSEASRKRRKTMPYVGA